MPSLSSRKIVFSLALFIDLLFGDPPNKFHPVAWIGNLIAVFKKRRPYNDPGRELAYGAGIVSAGGLLLGGIGWLLRTSISRLPKPLNWVLEAILLKSMFALRGLDQAAGEVQAALGKGDLPEARRSVSWHLVSRETQNLDESGVAAAAIESVAENTSDSLVAPVFYYFVGGLPLAFAYRVFNTADAMLGYRTPEYEWLGKIPARLDDVMNFIPARLTAGLLWLAAPLLGFPGKRVLETVRRDARKTESPNAGYPMSAMAGALGVELEKVDHYRLGDGQRRPETADIFQARKLIMALGLLGLVAAWLLPIFGRRQSQ